MRRIAFTLCVIAMVLGVLWWQWPGARVTDGTLAPRPAVSGQGREAPVVTASPPRTLDVPVGQPTRDVDALVAFADWTGRYLDATPEGKAALTPEGARLAQARRPLFKELITTDPERALREAVPMVVRQQLPAGIVALLEERVNRRADVRVYQGVPVPGVPVPGTLTHRIAAFTDGTAYVANVYGRRALDVLGTRNDALNGVAVDNQFAVNDEPVRVMEAGEKPDPAKQVVTSCPVSGKEVVTGAEAANPVPQDTTVVETPEQVVYLCGGYHKDTYTSYLYAEGGTGGPIPVSGILPAAPTPALGMVKVIFIPMTFADQNAIPATEAKCYQVMRDVADYYAKSSFGKLTTITTVTPPIKLPHNEAWYVQKDTSNGGTVDGLSLERDHARVEAQRLGYDWRDYDCSVVRLNGGPRVVGGWGGSGTVWIYSDSVGVTAHEIGHSFGLSHANFWDTAGTSAIGAGTNAEYGDQYDVMGGGGVPTDHYNAQAKNQVKWLPSEFLLDVTQSGTYRVHAFDQPILDPLNRYAMRITKDSQRVYWGEVRQLYNGSSSRPWADKGMILGWRYPSGGASNIQLIDTTPGSPFAKDDAAISLGQTFSDFESGIHMTTVDVGSTTPKYVDVVVNMGQFPGNHAPTLTLAATAEVVPVGTTVTFTATAADADSDTLAYAWQNFGDTSVKIVSPNAGVITRTFSTAGSYVVTCTASDMKGGSTTRSKLITVGSGNSRSTIAGRVTVGGVGLSDVIVNANGSNAVITDSDGYYVIPNLAAGTYSMTPLLYGYTFTEVFNNSVTVAPNFTGADFVAEATPHVSLTASAPDAQEPGTGTAVVNGTFTITRTGDISQAMTVNVNTAGGTATKGTDYTFSPDYVTGSQGFSTFTIPADAASLDVTVTPLTDASAEGPETVILQLGPGASYLVSSQSQGTVTINDDPVDTTLPKISLAVTTPTTAENSGQPAVLTFTRTGATTADLTVNYTVGGTATAGSDYTALSGNVVILIGSSSAVVNVTPINDSSVESVETVIVTASTNAAYLIQSGANTGTLSIVDEDVPVVTVVAADNAAAEVDLSVGGAQANSGTFLITRTGDTSEPLTVYYALSGPTTGETALHGVDYEALPGVLTIPAGAASSAVAIMPRWDNLGEGTENVTLNLGAGPTNYKLGAANTATVVITDAASNVPTVDVIGLTTPVEPSTNGAFRFTVRSPSVTPVTVNFALTGTAVATGDYTITTSGTVSFDSVTQTGSITITPSVTAPVSQSLTLTTVNNAVAEDLETVTLTIVSSSAYQTFTPTSSATLWMKDDDAPTMFVDPHVTNYPPSVAESGSAVAFYLSRTGSTTSALTVNYTISGSATNGTDYDNGTTGTPLSGTAAIAAGSSGVDVTVRPFNDTTFEGAETIVLSLTSSATYGRGPDATLYLTDNETSTQTVAFSGNSASASESAGTVDIPVTLASTATAPVTVEYVVDSGTRASSTTTATATLPYWVRVVRSGSSMTFFQSGDGVIWTQRGGTVTVAMSSASYLAGIAVTSGQSGTANDAVVDSVSITGLSAGGAAGAVTSADVGTVTPAGSDSESGGVYSISAGGGSINSGVTTDGFHYVWFPITNSANCTLTARVVSETGSTTLTRAGVMLRESTATGSRYAASLAQRGGTFLQAYRASTSSTSTQVSYTTIVRPWWVRLERAGDLFTASSSPDGSTWTTVGTPQTMALATEVLAGLAVSARSDGSLSTATFDNVSLTGSPVLVGRTVGYVNAQGTDSLAGGVYTVNGSGAAVGSAEDECHFVAAPVTGDFTLVARVLTQSGGAANAQAGVMVRESAAYRTRSLYHGSVANAGTEFICRNSTVTNAFGDGVDFEFSSGILNFDVGELTKTIPFDLFNDSLAEPDEAVTVLLRNPSGAILGTQTQFTYTIVDDDNPPALPSVGFSAGASSVLENAGAATVTVVLSAPASATATVDYAFSGGSAANGADFDLPAGTVTFAPGETAKTITVDLLDDTDVEGGETLVVALSNPTGAVTGSLNQHTLTITDDDFPTVTVAATDAGAAESGDGGTFTITRIGSVVGALVVNYTRSGTATSGADYAAIATPGSVTIPDGQPSATVAVSPNQDAGNEGNETVILTLTANAAYTVGTPSSATVTIADDDRSTVTIAANDADASETAGNPGQLTITRTAPTTGSLTVNLSISGTATNGTDYATVSTSVSFSAGQSSRTIDITPVDDGTTEGAEVVTVTLSSGSYVIDAVNFGIVTIADNDSPPTIFVSNPTAQGPLIASGNGLFVGCTVSDDGAPQPVTVQWSMASGPGTAEFESPTAQSTAVKFSADGVYVLKVTATDSQFTSSDQVTVVVGAAIAPAEWITQDLSPISQFRGQTQFLSGGHTLTGTGVGYTGSADGGHVMMRQVTGDASVVARLTSLSGAATGLAGVSIRDSLFRGARRAVLGHVAGTGLQFRTRTTASVVDTTVTQSGITLPVWLRLERNITSGEIAASYAADVSGSPGTWNAIGTPTAITMDTNAVVGLTCTSSVITSTATATFDNAALTPAAEGSTLLTEDFGSSNPNAGTYLEAAGTYTIGGSGGLDSGGYFAGRQFFGDLMVTAKLSDATSTATSAKSGIMIRESMDSGGYVFLGRIPTGSFSGFLWRTIAGGGGGGVPSFTGKVRWMRLIRRGNSVTAFHAADVSGSPGTWTQIGQPQTVIMNPGVLVGFAVDNSGGTGLNTCVFNNLSILPLNKAPIVDAGILAAGSLTPAALDGTVVDDSYPTPPSLTTLWSKLSGPGSVSFGDATLVDTAAAFSADGSYMLRLQADDSSAETFDELAFTGYLTSYNAWQAANWPSGSGDPNAALTLDADSDGLSNLLEYALATNPQTASADPVVMQMENVSSENYLRLTVAKNPAATDVIYEVQATADLSNPASWSSSGLVIEENTSTTLRVRDNVPVSAGSRRFMRLLVTKP